MDKSTPYMTVEECKLYRELSAKHEADTLRMAPSLPCYQLYPKVKGSPKRKTRRKSD